MKRFWHLIIMVTLLFTSTLSHAVPCCMATMAKQQSQTQAEAMAAMPPDCPMMMQQTSDKQPSPEKTNGDLTQNVCGCDCAATSAVLLPTFISLNQTLLSSQPPMAEQTFLGFPSEAVPPPPKA